MEEMKEVEEEGGGGRWVRSSGFPPFCLSRFTFSPNRYLYLHSRKAARFAAAEANASVPRKIVSKSSNLCLKSRAETDKK